MNKTLEIAIILSAVDKASRVLNEVFNKQSDKLREMQERSSKMMLGGGAAMAAGGAITASLLPAVEAYATLEQSQTRLEASMMKADGTVDKYFESVSKLAVELGDKLPGSTEDFINMMTVLNQNGISSERIMNGVGKAAANLAVVLELPTTQAAEFAAKMQFATQTADGDMMKLLDMTARAKYLGMDVQDIAQAFSKGSAAMSLMGESGLKGAQDLMPLLLVADKLGLRGESSGNAIRKMVGAFLNADKLEKANDALSQLGINLQFADANGNFAGMENMLRQLEKLQGLDATTRGAVLGKFGDDAETMIMLNGLIDGGVKKYGEWNNKLKEQADLQSRVNKMLDTSMNIWEAITGTLRNIKAFFGTAIGEDLKRIGMILRDTILPAISKFVQEHPKLMRIVGWAIALTGALIAIGGSMYFIAGAWGVAFAGLRMIGIVTALTNLWWNAQLILNSTMMGFPVVWILAAIAAVIAAGYLVYKYWDQIKAFFVRMWERIKEAFWLGVEWVKKILWDYHPYVLIYRHWDGIVAWFSDLWNKIIAGIEALGARFIQAGENIVNSLKQGIENKWEEFKGWWGEKMQGIRDFLPFSPAKTGPLRDIHRLKLMETIAASVRMEPLRNAMAKSTGMAMAAVPRTLATANSSRTANYGGTSIVYSPNITIGAGSDVTSFKNLLKEHTDELMRMISEYDNRKQRLSYS